MRRVAIVSRDFYPINSPRSFRATELAKEFAKRGNSVMVFTEKIPGVHDEFEKESSVEIIDTGRLSFKMRHYRGKYSLIKLYYKVRNRLLLQYLEYPSVKIIPVVVKALRNAPDVDILISVAVPHPIHWGTALIRRKKRLANCWIADCGDPYYGAKTEKYSKPIYFRWIENYSLSKADYITVPTEESVTAYDKRLKSKMRVIPQGVNFESFKLQIPFQPNSCPTFLYAGSFIKTKREPTELILHLLQLNVPFKFFIYTGQKEDLQDFVKFSDKRIIVRDYIDRDALIYEMSKMDFLVNLENNTEVQTPSKLIDYAIAGRPVLSIKTGQFNADALNAFLKGDYSAAMVLKDTSRFRIENVVNQFYRLADERADH